MATIIRRPDRSSTTGGFDGWSRILSRKAELLRQKLDTLGQAGKPGADIQNVTAGGVSSEGRDAKTVAHILWLRA